MTTCKTSRTTRRSRNRRWCNGGVQPRALHNVNGKGVILRYSEGSRSQRCVARAEILRSTSGRHFFQATSLAPTRRRRRRGVDDEVARDARVGGDGAVAVTAGTGDVGVDVVLTSTRAVADATAAADIRAGR